MRSVHQTARGCRRLHEFRDEPSRLDINSVSRIDRLPKIREVPRWYIESNREAAALDQQGDLQLIQHGRFWRAEWMPHEVMRKFGAKHIYTALVPTPEDAIGVAYAERKRQTNKYLRRWHDEQEAV